MPALALHADHLRTVCSMNFRMAFVDALEINAVVRGARLPNDSVRMALTNDRSSGDDRAAQMQQRVTMASAA
jgi:hypothetical protein